ncbi:unnamed protein product, partial [Rotaria magnacalcarata]
GIFHVINIYEKQFFESLSTVIDQSSLFKLSPMQVQWMFEKRFV